VGAAAAAPTSFDGASANSDQRWLRVRRRASADHRARPRDLDAMVTVIAITVA